MSILHEEFLEDNLVRRWANDCADVNIEDYYTPKYLIHKINTNEYYADAVDLSNACRTKLDIGEYHYEATNMPIEFD